MNLINYIDVSKKIQVFTDCDLDGASSLLTLEWLLKAQRLPYITTRVNDFRKTFLKWLETHNLKSYEKVFILDLDISQDCLDLVDHDNIVIIDHHDTHYANRDKYKTATTIIEECSSCAKLVYTKFKDLCQLSQHQQYLILLADDYDSYELKLKESYPLNIVYWSYQGDRFAKFKKDFQHGFFGFTKFHNNIINFHEKRLENLKQTLEVFEATIPIDNKPRKIVSAFADTCINEIAEYIISEHKSDIGMVVNLKTNKVSLRKSKTCDVHLGELSQKLLKGGGHEYAAGGLINDGMFLNFSKMLKPVSC